MKTTIELSNELADRARAVARRTGRTLRSLVEEGLRRVLDEPPTAPYEVPDRRVGRPGDPDPLATMTWEDLRDTIYGGR